MKWTSSIKPNVFFYIGIIVGIVNAVFLGFNFFLSLLSIAIILFSDTFTEAINTFLKGSH
ncbi:hypothetical protein [Enterococcus malodoratus]|uniref:Uncharacterized protein n=1 Tax=Enterococcus malodoratus ATCC 43197 TaxID=1158601 RepID=R2NR99_9ENTE|nr:hypothetical protein [Enterococcus malodoratus]EOH73493.1 hypothetical protein UAI_03590 [Enterococcus malodoratus ATCC 43197]EOT67251.1 hypothetical protein I585_02772 [Enterococcus malodoratus ATCC 43197]OJG57503.1 hypothetical protein RV07_GL003341 [Enterococcus malodoratus]SPW90871.1 Uncharacterised protein [Enterococcus malodoratus]STD69497.1 Uncharacterised protein [Enterococcus malodoratus]